MQYIVVILFIPLLAELAEINFGMNIIQEFAFQNQNQNQNQNQKYILLLKTCILCERWSLCEKLFPTNYAQLQSVDAQNHKLCKESSPHYQKNIFKIPALA